MANTYNNKQTYNKSNSYSKKQTYTQPIQPPKPDFNDVLDVLNPNFTPVEKLHGMVSLPFQPVLHPLKTIKGVFETYSKIASVPLAVYSGNLDRVKGIVQGTDDFSGKDVVAQMYGTDKANVHGILPSLAGFGLDIASDPFVGVARVPEEIAQTFNHLTIQAAAPGLPQALNWMGAKEWTARWFGTGMGFGENKDIAFIPADSPIHTVADRSIPVQQKITHQINLDNMRMIRNDAKEQALKLNPAVTQVDDIRIPNADKETIYIHNPESYLQGFQFGLTPQENAIYKASGQSATDIAELKRIATTQKELRSYNNMLGRQTNVVTPAGALEQAKKDAELSKKIFYIKQKNLENKIVESDEDIIKRLHDEQVAREEVKFGLQDTLQTFGNPENPIASGMRFLKDKVARREHEVSKFHTPFELKWDGSKKHFKLTDSDSLVWTDNGAVPKSQWAKDPSKYNRVFKDVNQIFREHLTSTFDSEGIGQKEIYNELFKSSPKFMDTTVGPITQYDINELIRERKIWKQGKNFSKWAEEVSTRTEEQYMVEAKKEVKRLTDEIEKAKRLFNEQQDLIKEVKVANSELPEAHEYLSKWLSGEDVGADYPKILDSLPKNPTLQQFEDWAKQHMPDWWAAKEKDLYAKLDSAIHSALKKSELSTSATESQKLRGGSDLPKFVTGEQGPINTASFNMTQLASDVDESRSDAMTQELWLARGDYDFKRLLMVDVDDLPDISKSSVEFQERNTVIDTMVHRKLIKYDAKVGGYVATTDILLPKGFNSEFRMRTLFPRDLVEDFARNAIEILPRLDESDPMLVDDVIELLNLYKQPGDEAARLFQNKFKLINNEIADSLSGTNLVGDVKFTGFSGTAEDTSFGEQDWSEFGTDLTNDEELVNDSIDALRPDEAVHTELFANPLRQLDEVLQPLKRNYTETGTLDMFNQASSLVPSYVTDASQLDEATTKGFKSMVDYETIRKGQVIKYTDPNEHEVLSELEDLDAPVVNPDIRAAKEYNKVKAKAPYVDPTVKKLVETNNKLITIKNLELDALDHVPVVSEGYNSVSLSEVTPETKVELLKSLEDELDQISGTAFITTVQDAIEESAVKETIAAEKYLSAEQLAMHMAFRQGIAKHNILKKLDKVLLELQKFAESQGGNEAATKKLINKINNAAVRELHTTHAEVIDGKNLAIDLLNRNNTIVLNNNTHTGQLAKLNKLSARLNEEIGIEGLFKVRQLDRPNAHWSKFELDHEVLRDNPTHLKTYKEWLLKNKDGMIGYDDIHFDLRVKSRLQTLTPDELVHAHNLIDIMIEMNSQINEFYKFAGLSEQVTMDASKFFPHSSVDVMGQNAQDAITKGKGMIRDQNVTLADMMKRDLGLTGTLSSSAYGRSVMGNPFSAFINIEDEAGKLKPVPLFSRNPQTAYRNMFSSAFADHTNLRMTKELILNNRYKLENLTLPKGLPDSAIATHDILIPEYVNGQLVGLRSYAPTSANMAKYAKHGYLIDRTVSAEIRSMLKYESYVSKSPLYNWFMKNIMTPFKSGVLLNLGFPIGNAGDMYYKTLSETKFKDLPEYHKNLMAAPAIIKAHSDHLRAYATLINSEAPGIKAAMRDVPYIEYLRNMIHWTEGKGEAEWMKLAPQHLEDRAALMDKGVKVQDDLWKAMQYEIYIALPTATTNQAEIVASMSEMKRKWKDVEFKKYIEDVLGSKVGNTLRRISMDNTPAKRFAEFNENLENGMRFAHFATMTGLSKDTAREVLKDKELIWHANAMLKDTHMHFAEYPGNAVWLSAVFPFWQFPIKNAVWWTRFIGKHPELASQVYRFKKSMWGQDDDSFWSQMGAIPANNSMVLRGIPGLGSLSSFALSVDHPTDIMGQRLNPIIRPFLSKNGSTYHSYSIEDRDPKSDSMLSAWLHGMNPVEGNVQWGLNVIGSKDPLFARLMPSVFRAQSQQDLAQQQQTKPQAYNKTSH